MKPIFLCALLLAGSVHGADPAGRSHRFIEEMTSPEVRAAVASGTTTILVPIGGTEQNGDHIALGKHNVRAQALAAAIAARLGNALVAPVVSYVPEGNIAPPTGHMRQPGTITVPEEAFERMLESAAKGFIQHGFTAVVLLGDHGGYRRSLEKVRARVNVRASRPVVFVPEEYYREMEHAGTEDTALTLAIDPSLVRDPRGASVEKGREARDQIVERTVAAIRRATAR
jgi:creatinine amidohydrolase/Fe(II)-dependent formamide hydrolase-like protein